MLQFIILGYVPGTSVQLSFYAIVLAITVGLSVFSSWKFAQYHNAQRKFAGLMPLLLKKQSRIRQRQDALSIELQLLQDEFFLGTGIYPFSEISQPSKKARRQTLIAAAQ